LFGSTHHDECVLYTENIYVIASFSTEIQYSTISCAYNASATWHSIERLHGMTVREYPSAGMLPISSAANPHPCWWLPMHLMVLLFDVCPGFQWIEPIARPVDPILGF
jgi:hypothetical protein